MAGLSVETLLLSIPAAGWLVYLNRSGAGVFLNASVRMDLLLLCACAGHRHTAAPFYRRGPAPETVHQWGFLQYIAPTCMFFLGVFAFGEPFSRAHAITFILIWTALAVYSLDSARAYGGTRK